MSRSLKGIRVVELTSTVSVHLPDDASRSRADVIKLNPLIAILQMMGTSRTAWRHVLSNQ